MGSVFSGFGVLQQQPLIGLVVFLVVSAAALSVLSEGRLVPALGNLLRVAITFFTTPFLFLRDALNTIVAAGSEEKSYARTRVFMLFRYSRLLYLGIITVALLILSGGLTGAVIALSPQEEMAQHKYLSENIKTTQEQIDALQASTAGQGNPATQKAALEKRRDDAKKAYDQQARQTADFAASATIGQDLVNQLAGVRSAERAASFAAEIEGALAGCPNNSYVWSGFSRENCVQFGPFVRELAGRKAAEFQLSAAYQDAESALSNAESSAQETEANLNALKANLEQQRQARSQISLFNPTVIGSKLGGALSVILATLFAVVFVVWAGAIFIDVVNWLILLMRSSEIQNDKTVREHTPALAEEDVS